MSGYPQSDLWERRASGGPSTGRRKLPTGQGPGVCLPATLPSAGRPGDRSPPGEGMRGVEPLIDVTSLARSLAAGPLPVLLDVRWRLAGSPGPPGIVAYQAGHLPGAVFTDLDRDLSGVP